MSPKLKTKVTRRNLRAPSSVGRFSALLEKRLVPTTFYVREPDDNGANEQGVPYLVGGLPVANSGDLRWCIYQANVNPGSDIIEFDSTIGLDFDGSDSIQLSKTLGSLVLADNVVLGNASAPALISGISGQPGAFRIFDVKSAPYQTPQVLQFGTQLIYLTVTHGYAQSVGGGAVLVQAQGANESITLTINNSTLQNNTAASSGTTNFNGGAILAIGATTVTMNSSTITANTASGNGGAIQSDKSLVFTDCAVNANTARGNGGGIFTTGATSFTHGSIHNNIAGNTTTKSDGGGIFADQAQLTIAGTAALTSNTAFGNGGGVSLLGGTLTSTTLGGYSGNSATVSGGAIYATGKVNITGQGKDDNVQVHISSNSAGKGGGVNVLSGGSLTLSFAELKANIATGSGGGGGIRLENVSTSVNNKTLIHSAVELFDCVADQGNGGGILIVGGGLIEIGDLHDSSYTDVDIDGKNIDYVNSTSAKDFGGGVCIQDFHDASSLVTIKSTRIYNLSGAQNGGGLAIVNSSRIVAIRDSMITNNTVTGSGANVYLDNPGTVSIDTCELYFGAASNKGGGVDIINGDSSDSITIKSCVIGAGGRNDAAFGGGIAIYDTGANVSVSDCTIGSNRALTTADEGHGGGFWISGATGQILFDSCILETNVAYGSGGGGYIHASTNVTISECHVGATNGSALSGNTANVDGAGLFINQSKVLIDSCTIDFNSAVESGGGVALLNSADVRFVRSTIDNNTASNGAGGGLCYAGGVANTIGYNIENSTVSNNVAYSGSGGGIYLSGTIASGAFKIVNTTISGNTTNGSGSISLFGHPGGGLQIDNAAGTVQVLNSTIVMNHASNGGGIESDNSATLVIKSSIIASNEDNGAGYGPDMYFENATTISVNHSIVGIADEGKFSLSGSGNQTGTFTTKLDPLLDPLANYGGITMTHRLKAGSPALNMGSNPESLEFDQRGTGFVRSMGQTDVGAYEYPIGAYLSDASALVVNHRSLVKTLVVSFAEPMSFAGNNVASAFTLHRSGTGGTTGNVALTANPSSGPASSVTITFSGTLTEFGSLVDGKYDLTIDSSKVSGFGGALDGDNNGTPGGNYVVTGSVENLWFRYFGDFGNPNGGAADGAVTQDPDFIAFRNAFGANPADLLIFDFDNSGAVDQADFVKFRNNFGGSP